MILCPQCYIPESLHQKLQVVCVSWLCRSPKLVEIIAALPEEHKATLLPQLKVRTMHEPVNISYVKKLKNCALALFCTRVTCA